MEGSSYIVLNKKVLAASYLLLIIGAAFLSKSIFEKYTLQRKGTEIEVTILRIPSCENISKRNYKFLKFSFENNSYQKRLKGKYCKKLRAEGYKEGSKMKLKTNEENNSFVFPFENLQFEIISFILVELVFIYCLLRLLMNLKRRN